MIGLMNVPCDSPIDFYAEAPLKNALNLRKEIADAAAARAIAQSPPNGKGMVPALKVTLPCSPPTNGVSGAEEEKPLFVRRRYAKKMSYLPDGRRLCNGELAEATGTGKLWEQLLVRTLVHRIEDEVNSPAQRLSMVQQHFDLAPAGIQHRRSSSTFSLVSDERVKDACDKCCQRERSSSSACAQSEEVVQSQAQMPDSGLWFSFNKLNADLNEEDEPSTPPIPQPNA